jgi:hypothetical protein
VSRSSTQRTDNTNCYRGKRAREQESKRAREQESKRAREQESKRAREQDELITRWLSVSTSVNRSKEEQNPEIESGKV